jgi:lysophospholipase L1-like esterase
LPLAKCNRLVFFGDSITQQGYWVGVLEVLLLVTRPDLELEFANAGSDGDRAVHASWRLATDVVARRPDVVTVLFGMNDGGYLEHDARRLATFEKDLDGMVAKLAKEAGARVVVLGPTFFDDGVRDAKQKKPFYNDVLLEYERTSQRVAEAYKSAFIALNEPMRRATEELRKSDPKATLSPDGVHPEVAGGFCIANAIASELWRDPAPVELFVAPAADGGVDHVVKVARIPLPIPPEAKKVADLCKLEQRFNRMTLKAVGVGTGSLDVHADGSKLGTWTASELAAGVVLAGPPDAPWCKRSAELWRIAEQRRKLIKTEVRDKVTAIKLLKDEKQRQESYAKVHASLASAYAKVRALEDKMRALCRPFEVKVTIVPAR